MTGIPLFNFPAFDEGRDRWRAAGWDVVSPADLTRQYWIRHFGEEFDPSSTDPRISAGGDIYNEFIRGAVRVIADCHVIALLPGWERSGGVGKELTVSRLLSLPELDAGTMLPMNPPPRPGSKDTNPKDAIAGTKLPVHLVPQSAIAVETLALVEGALKYGKYNWRVAGVRASVYIDALFRHLFAYDNGEDCDPKTGVPHLASLRACAGILIDAQVCGKLTDDRPPSAPVGELVRSLEADVVRLQGVFKDHRPHQYTIADSPAKG